MRSVINIMTLALTVIIFTGCTTQESKANSSDSTPGESYTIRAKGYGESREKAVEDAKNDALRQFGYKVTENDGSPELKFAGKITEVKVQEEISEPLKEATWWEIELEADIKRISEE